LKNWWEDPRYRSWTDTSVKFYEDTLRQMTDLAACAFTAVNMNFHIGDSDEDNWSESKL
jgi:hypothetical protein